MVGFVLLLGCYEIPPEAAADRMEAPLPAGWPPLAVYHEDPFHPANLLFQRLFLVDGAAAGAASAGDVPVSPRGPLEPLDQAELATYAERIIRIAADREQSLDALSPRGAAMLGRDVTIERGRLNDRRAPGDNEVAATLDRLTNAVTAPASEPLPALPAPPDGALTATALPRIPPHDRLRPPRGDLEAWTIEGIYQFRRTRWLRGEAPWVRGEGWGCGECHKP